MTDLKATMPTAVRRALELLADPSAEPDISNAYLDLLDAGVPTGTPAAEMFYASAIGSRVYANMAPLMHRLFTFQPPMEWLNIPADVVALDVGCGPAGSPRPLPARCGAKRTRLGRRHLRGDACPRGAGRSGPQLGFLRVDAKRLPLNDETVDVVTSVAVLLQVPDPAVALGEMARVLRTGGRLAVRVPAGWWANRFRQAPNRGLHLFGQDEVGDILENHRFASVRTTTVGTHQWVRGKRG
jgi:SAM-dependent methyltransferase